MSNLLLKIASLPVEDRKKVEELVDSLIQKNQPKEENEPKPTEGWGYDD